MQLRAALLCVLLSFACATSGPNQRRAIALAGPNGRVTCFEPPPDLTRQSRNQTGLRDWRYTSRIQDKHERRQLHQQAFHPHIFTRISENRTSLALRENIHRLRHISPVLIGMGKGVSFAAFPNRCFSAINLPAKGLMTASVKASADVAVSKIVEALKVNADASVAYNRIRAEVPNLQALEALDFRLC